MKACILRFGVIAGLVVSIPMIVRWLRMQPTDDPGSGMIAGYLIMFVALTMVFVGIKQYRDKSLGGVIRFGQALGLGLAISAVAGLFYCVAWELCLAFGSFDFNAWYANSLMEAARARGATPAELEKVAADAASFSQMYSNPLVRMPMSFLEIFPVGVLISLVAAALLRNPSFLPARAAP